MLRQVHRVAPSPSSSNVAREFLPGERLVGGCRGFLPVCRKRGNGVELWWVLQSELDFLPSLDQALGEHLIKPFMISQSPAKECHQLR
jgi:hypothetical protein